VCLWLINQQIDKSKNLQIKWAWAQVKNLRQRCG
jgi:hypothetical protein